MILRVDDARPLERPQIPPLLDDDDKRLVAPLVAADRARRDGVDVAAARAFDNPLDRHPHGLGEGNEQLLASFQERERSLPRRAGPEARQARQELNETLDLWPCDLFRHWTFRAPVAGAYCAGADGWSQRQDAQAHLKGAT